MCANPYAVSDTSRRLPRERWARFDPIGARTWGSLPGPRRLRGSGSLAPRSSILTAIDGQSPSGVSCLGLMLIRR